MADAGRADDLDIKAAPLGLVTERAERYADAGYFIEEVRRQLLARYGEKAEDGPNSVYAGGLWVRTSLDPELQDAFHEWFLDGGRAPDDYEGIEHVETDPMAVPYVSGTQSPAHAEQEARGVDLDSLDID